MKRFPFKKKINFQPFKNWFIFKRINTEVLFRDEPKMSSKTAVQEEVISRFRFTSTKATHQVRNIKERVKLDRSHYKKKCFMWRKILSQKVKKSSHEHLCDKCFHHKDRYIGLVTKSLLWQTWLLSQKIVTKVNFVTSYQVLVTKYLSHKYNIFVSRNQFRHNNHFLTLFIVTSYFVTKIKKNLYNIYFDWRFNILAYYILLIDILWIWWNYYMKTI